jgi:spermidine/putrescine transport system permease protein
MVDSTFEMEAAPSKSALRRLILEIIAYLTPIIFIVVVLVFAPLLIILFFSFLKSGPYGEIIYSFSLENFKAIFVGGYGMVFLNSIYLAFQTNIFCILIGYPIAYYIAIYGGKWKAILLFLVIVPSWSSYLIRLYALKTIVGSKGIVNEMLLGMGIISEPLRMLYTPFAVMTGLVYAWIPFMILPIYASIEGLDRSVLEAASDLGATPVRRFFRVTLPLTKGGIIAGSILVFIPTVGEWLVPHVLGGSKIMMAGSLVAQKFTEAGNIPGGSSLSVMLATILILILFLTIKYGGRDAMERMI